MMCFRGGGKKRRTRRKQSGQMDKNEIESYEVGNQRLNMESEVKLKRGRRADPVMIASKKKKGNRTMELVGVKVKSNEEIKPKRNEAIGADQTD